MCVTVLPQLIIWNWRKMWSRFYFFSNWLYSVVVTVFIVKHCSVSENLLAQCFTNCLCLCLRKQFSKSLASFFAPYFSREPYRIYKSSSYTLLARTCGHLIHFSFEPIQSKRMIQIMNGCYTQIETKCWFEELGTLNRAK